MRFPTELRIYIEKPKPKTFFEYIADQLCSGRNININLEGEFIMVEYLREKRQSLIEQKENLTCQNDEEAIAKKVAEYEAKVRVEFDDLKNKDIAHIDIKIEVLNELIAEQERIVAEKINEENEQHEEVNTDVEVVNNEETPDSVNKEN